MDCVNKHNTVYKAQNILYTSLLAASAAATAVIVAVGVSRLEGQSVIQ